MKISCLQENFHKALSIVSHSIGKESGLPILSNILLKVEENFITLSATNLEIGIHYTLRGKIEGEGAVTLDAKVLSEYVALLPKEKIELEVNEDNMVSIKCENYTTKMRGISADDFPIIPTLERTQPFIFSAKDLRNALKGALFTIAFDESRPELNGLLFQYRKEAGHLVVVGTDAYRLAKRFVPVRSEYEKDLDIILPERTLHELERILQVDIEKDVEMYMNENQVLFVCDGVELLSKVINSNYPDYEQIIPSTFSFEGYLEVKEFLKAIKISSIFSRSGLSDVHFTFKSLSDGKGEVSISAANANVGENIAILPIECKGNEITLTLNYRYILEGLQSFDDDRLFFGAGDSQSPCVIRPVKGTEPLYLIMPIRE